MISKKVAIVLSCFNEEENIPVVYQALKKAVKNVSVDLTYVFVDDGSTDATFGACQKLMQQDDSVKVVKLTRNFGHEIAMTAGMEQAGNVDAVVFMDSDMQHPPALVPKMIELWLSGADVVLTKRQNKLQKSGVYHFFSWGFYKVLSLLSKTEIASDTPDFRLIDKSYLVWLKQCQEPDRLFRGLLNWIKPSSTCAVVPFDVPPRFSGTTKYNFKRCFKLAINSLIQFSELPLYLSFYVAVFLGIITLGLFGTACFCGGLWWLASLICFLGTLQFTILGVMGLYLAKIHVGVKKRPLYCAHVYQKNHRLEEK